MSRQRRGKGRSTRPVLVSVFTKGDVLATMAEQGKKFSNDDLDGCDARVLTGLRLSEGWEEISAEERLRFFLGPQGQYQLWLDNSADVAKDMGLRPKSVQASELPDKVAAFFFATLVPVRSRHRLVVV